MAQHVRMHARQQTLRQTAALQAQLDHAHSEARAALTDEEGCFAVRRQPRALRHPICHRQPCLATNRDDARLVALAEHPHLTAQQLFHAGQVEPCQLGKAQAGRIEKLEHRLIAQLQQIVALRREKPVRLIGREHLRQRLRALRRADAIHRVVGRLPALAKPAIETTPGRQRTPQRSTAEPAHVQLRDETAYVVRLNARQTGFTGQFPEQQAEQFEVVTVAPDRMRRRSPLLCQFIQKGTNARRVVRRGHSARPG